MTTPSASFDLVNTTATTVNFAKAATALSIGSTSGTTTVNNDFVVTGNVTVNGTTTTVNAVTITVDDKNLELGSVASPTDVTAEGGGITLKGATDKTINWVGSTAAWTSSENFNLLTGKAYEIDGTSVLSNTTLGTGVVNSSLTSVGTLGSLIVTSNISAGTGSYISVSGSGGGTRIRRDGSQNGLDLQTGSVSRLFISDVDGNVIVRSTTNATSNTTGALIVAGGVGIAGNIAAADVVITGTSRLGTVTSGTWNGSSISTTYTDAKVTSVNGQTGAATGFATTANTLAQFAATTSAQLAGVITDETGTGSLVFATTPTLITPILGLATGTSVMLSANIGAAAGNVSGNFTVGSLQTTGNVTADRVLTVNNGNSENLRIGDDIWLGDYNIANSLKLKGINDPAAAFISFGNSDGATLGRTGLGALTYTAGFAAANIVVTNNVNSASGLITGSLSAGNIRILPSGVLTFADGTTQSTAVSGAITSVNGRTGVVTGLAETANSLSQFASTTSAQLATLISDETGTGSLVFARSPTLLTATATAIGSNTTPAFRVFDTFNRTINFLPNVSAGSYNNIVTTNDSLIYFTGTGINTGNLVIAPHAAYNFGLKLDAVGNTIYMYGDTRATGNATFTGSVGVGLTSPGAILETEENTTGATEHRITNSNTGANTTKNARLTFRLTDTVGIRKDVAFITAVPNNADSSTGDNLTFSTRTADAAPTEKVRINNDGNVLVGAFTTSISKKFTVIGEGNFTDASTNTRLYMGYGTIPSTGGNGAYVYNGDNSALAFGTSNTERLRVTALGGVAFGGAANYGTSGQLLQSNGDAAPTWVSANTLTANIANFINVTDDTTTNATRYPIFANAASGNVNEQVSSTKLTFNPSTGLLTSTDYNSSSDRRLKKNIKTVENALDKVIALRGVSFDWKEGGTKAFGLIAQETKKVIPEVVDQDENGYLGIKYNNLIGVLVEAIKDQQDQINILKKLMEKS